MSKSSLRRDDGLLQCSRDDATKKVAVGSFTRRKLLVPVSCVFARESSRYTAVWHTRHQSLIMNSKNRNFSPPCEGSTQTPAAVATKVRLVVGG